MSGRRQSVWPGSQPRVCGAGRSPSAMAWRVDRRVGPARRAARSAADARGRTAPIDLTGTWVAIVTEDYRWRMVTPPKGDVASVPVNGEGRKAAMAWESRRRQRRRHPVQGVRCRRHHAAAGPAAHLVAGPGHAEARVRRRHADAAAALRPQRAAGGRRRHGRDSRGRSGKVPASAAVPRRRPDLNAGPAGPPVSGRWRSGAARRSAAARTQAAPAGRLAEGRDDELPRGIPAEERRALQRAGRDHRILPPAADASQRRRVAQRRDTIVEDPRYLAQPFYTSTHFRREADGSKWNPTPCTTDPPLPVKAPARPARADRALARSRRRAELEPT